MSESKQLACITLSSGYEMPQVGLGTWQSAPGKVATAVETALLSNYRHIDGAAVYKNEAEVGAGIAAAISKSDLKRSDIFVTSKLWNTNHAPSAVEPACRQTLSDLGLDYLDLYLIHWPFGDDEGKEDYVDTWRAMEQLVSLGLVRSIGVSNFNHLQLDRIRAIATVPVAVNQVECNPRITQKPLIAYCKANNIAVTCYCPLGSPGSSWNNEPSLLQDAKIATIAAKYAKTSAQVMIRYQVQRGLIVIPKSVTPSRVIANGNVFDFELSDEDFTVLESFNKNYRVCGFGNKRNHPHYPFSAEY